MQVVPRALRHQRQVGLGADAPAPVQVAGHTVEQVVDGALPDDLQLRPVYGLEGVVDAPRQLRVVDQQFGHRQLAVAGGLFEQGGDLALQPRRVEVQGAVGEAALGGGVAVVDVAGLEEEHLAGGADVALVAAAELLHTGLGVADQVGVVPVRIVGVALEMRTQALDAGVGILQQVDPVVFVHGLPPHACPVGQHSARKAAVWKIRAAGGRESCPPTVGCPTGRTRTPGGSHPWDRNTIWH